MEDVEEEEEAMWEEVVAAIEGRVCSEERGWCEDARERGGAGGRDDEEEAGVDAMDGEEVREEAAEAPELLRESLLLDLDGAECCSL